MDKVNPAMLGHIATIAGSYLYWIASAGEAEAIWLLDQVADRCRSTLASEVARERQLLAELDTVDLNHVGRGRLQYVQTRLTQALRSITRLGKSGAMVDQMNQHIQRLTDQAAKAIMEFERAYPQSEANTAADTNAEGAMRAFVPRRLHLSTVTFDDLPIDQREGYASPRWSVLSPHSGQLE